MDYTALQNVECVVDRGRVEVNLESVIVAIKPLQKKVHQDPEVSPRVAQTLNRETISSDIQNVY